MSIPLLTIGSISYCQQRSLSPYFGLSGSLDTNGNPGWGLEAGLRFYEFFTGFEYGMYGYSLSNCVTCDQGVGNGTPNPYPLSSEQFWGLHAGYVFYHATIFAGIVMLKSYQTWEIPTTQFTGYSSTRNYLNVGPDFRYSGLAHGHLYLATAWTLRRGFKAGLGYVF